ncbi:class I mannose-6-phosphate isomerase [Erysipelothrix sp. HDW6A]|uniref:type I phosphomannose isomerase catalytic subunit n=1 Tax=Erysipelothrix sp. HDW6A TaxID=2714928 RepID=UPI0014087DCF|nr:type I phosphomannose isomerase catalytic subunit [Erysipelothrix sp. HDW6A]QIK57842.1 class I mannose-6-phosphate isomerase [Erysipelothrix sp. HDW6A]
MSVIKLNPSYKDYLWGGNLLKSEYQKDTDLNPLAESWEVSTHPDGPSVVANGEYQGLTLQEYINKKGSDVLGDNGKSFDRFPILIKFIDAKKDLSIQVHPDDEYGLKHENEYGKTEMWIILEALPDSKIYYGVKNEMTREEFAEAIHEDSILDKLKTVSVKKGDVIFVEAGTIHAIGAGIVICEIQQNSNTTYRVHDFNRKDANGNLRELHIQQSIDVSKLSPLDVSFKPSGLLETTEFGSKQLLARCKYFTTTGYTLNGSEKFSVDNTSFNALVVLEGTMSLTNDNQTLELKKGDSVFIDAGTDSIVLEGNANFIRVNV